MGIFGGWGKSSDEKATEKTSDIVQDDPAELITKEEGPAAAREDAAIKTSGPLFREPTPLSSKAHADLKVDLRQGDFGFASMLTLAPISFSEIGPASLCYPIIFSENTKLPYAVMGLQGGRNLFIGQDGRLDRNAYAPAHFRRYPFLFVSETQSEKDVLGLDLASDRVGSEAGQPLFEEGRPAAVSRMAFGFLSDLRRQEAIAKQAVGALVDEQLMEIKTIRLPAPRGTADDARPKLTFLGLNGPKMNELDAEKLGSLAKIGALAVAYAHFNSLHNWRKLLRRLAT